MFEREQILETARYLKRAREYLDSREYIEIQTAHAVPAGAFEASIDTLAVSFSEGRAQLHTSPEIEMKRALSASGLNLYQICRCFRDDPDTGVHLKEFTLLEFYRVGATYREILAETRSLIGYLVGRELAFQELSMERLVFLATGLELAKILQVEDLRRALRRDLGMLVEESDSWSDLFFKLLVEKLEPFLDPQVPTFVFDYPPALCALGKAAPEGHSVERFELYWKGMEIANGCTELRDIDEARLRFVQESKEREKQGKAPHPIPGRLFEALEAGLPPCGGVAIGWERLMVCLTGRPFLSYRA